MSNAATEVSKTDDHFHQASEYSNRRQQLLQSQESEHMKQQRNNTALASVNMRQMSPLLDTLDYVEESLFVLIGSSQDADTATMFLDESIRTVKLMTMYHKQLTDRTKIAVVDANKKFEVINHSIDLTILEIMNSNNIPWEVRRDCFESVPKNQCEDMSRLLHVLTKLHSVCNRFHVLIPGEIKPTWWQVVVKGLKAAVNW